MKKYLLIVIFVSVLLFSTSCGKTTETPPKTDPKVTEMPTGLPDNNESPTDKEPLTVEDYYPFTSDKKYIYEGEGNEYASYTVYTDFVDYNIHRVQTRTNNGGTESIKVMEMKDGVLSVLYAKGEIYYRDHLLNAKTTKKDKEILLMEPLIKGTQWTLTDNRKRFISDTEVEIQTPLGKYNALEVTTAGPNDVIKDYYAPNVGLVKTVFSSGNTEVSSTLSEIKKDAPFSKVIEFYYPNQDGKIIIEGKTLSFHTNDSSRIKIQESMREKAPREGLISLISPNTKINSLYLGKDNIAYIDFSKEFIDEMNLGASYESLVLQSITNTIGNYYGVQKVYLTVENKPYESGHILLEKGETLKVNMDSVEDR